jgi:hypothetical protein
MHPERASALRCRRLARDLVYSRGSVTTRKARMNRQQHRVARATCVALMQAGHSWQDAVAASALPIGRSAAYALVQRVRRDGDAALL